MHATRPTKLALALLALACPLAPAQDRGTPQPARERTVYVPIEKFDQVFDREKGGVFVPYHELLELLKKAGQPVGPTQPEVAPTPPADWVLVGAQLKGVAGERVVQFEATFDVEVLEKEGWVVVPISLGEAALEDVRTAAGQRAVVGPLAGLLGPSDLKAVIELLDRLNGSAPPPPPQGYGIVVKGAGRLQTTVKFAVPIQSRPGESSFGLSLPPAALCNFEVSLPQAGLRVRVDNALATEETSVAQSDQTKVRAYFGAASQARVTWNPRPKEIEGEKRDPLLFADTETSLYLDEGVLQTTTRIKYRILQAPCGEFKLQFPKGYTLLSVGGENMAENPVPEDAGEAQAITVRLHDKAKDTYELVVRLEKILAEGAQDQPFPRVVTLGTERESGMLAARTSRFLTLEPTTVKSVSQVDAGQITPTLAQDLKFTRGEERPPLVFRYLRQPWAIQLKSAQIEPEVDGKVMTLAMLRDNELALSSTILYTVRKRGIFGVRVRVPQGFQLITCEPARLIKDSRLEKTDKGDVLVVDFHEQVQPTAPGREFALTVLGNIPRSPNQLEGALELPRFGLLDVKKETGLLAIGAARHLQLQKTETGVVAVAPSDLPGLGFPHAARAGDEELVSGFSYNRPEAIKASYTIKKREPKVTARAEVLVDAQEDQVRVETRMIWLVEYAGIEVVKLRVPAELASEDKLKIEGDGISSKSSAPDAKSDKHAVWTIQLQGKRMGEIPLTLRYDIKLDDLAPGTKRDVPLHEIQAMDVFTETGDVGLKKHENLVITVEPQNMERRDKRELPEALRRQGPIQAYRYVSHPHALELNLIKYDFKAPLGILINHLHLDEVVGQDGKLQVEAWVSLQNNAEQFLRVELPEEASFVGLKVDGKSEEWSQGPKEAGKPQQILIHLGEVTKARPEQAFQIRLRWDLPGQGALSGTGKLVAGVPSFPLEQGQQVPVARLTRDLYLPPQGTAYLEFDTDATKHFEELSLWEQLKQMLGVPTGQERVHGWQGAQAAIGAVQQLKGMVADDPGSNYRPLDLPQGLEPYRFEKLDAPTRLAVRYMSWPLFYLLDVLVLVGVVALGVFFDLRKLVSPAAYVPVAAALMLLGATFGGKGLEPFAASGFVGALGLGGFFLLRGVWREATVLRHERRLAELAQEAQVARARAQAAEAEARLRAGQAPVAAAAPTPPVDPKARPMGPGEQAAADRIEFQDRPGGQS